MSRWLDTFVLALALATAVGPCAGQITNDTLNCTQAQLTCLDALSYELCSTDVSQRCQTAFFLDQYASESYAQMLCYYLVNRFVYQSYNPPISVAAFLLPQTLSANDTFAQEVDALYGSNCSRDPGVLALLANSTEAQAVNGRSWWLALLRAANFCAANQFYVVGMGCVWMESKGTESGTNPATWIVNSMIFLVVVVFFFVLWRFLVFSRSWQGLSRQFRTVMSGLLDLIKLLRDAAAAKQVVAPPLRPLPPVPTRVPPELRNRKAKAVEPDTSDLITRAPDQTIVDAVFGAK